MRIAIIGGGVAGLSCARHLTKNKIHYQLFEKEWRLGGRVQSDKKESYIFDQGFQVFNTAYPELKDFIPELQLGYFKSGALIWNGKKLVKFADPLSSPFASFSTLFSKVGTLKDYYKLSRLTAESKSFKLRDYQTTNEFLLEYGFSKTIIEQFFRPFFSGVLLNRELSTDASLFLEIFHQFSIGKIGLARQGARSLIELLAKESPNEQIVLGASIAQISPFKIVLENSKSMEFDTVVSSVALPETLYNSCTTLYFEGDRDPILQNFIVLNGSGTGIISNLAVISKIQPNYARGWKPLIQVTIPEYVFLPNEELFEVVKNELAIWFGRNVKNWRPLRAYRIKNALPQKITFKSEEEGLICCGDTYYGGTLNRALKSGITAAEKIIKLNR